MMTAETIIQDAIQNKETTNYNLLEIHLYLVIKQILKMYYNNQLSKEQANKYKTLAVKDYNNRVKQYEVEDAMFKEHIENIKKTESLKIKLRKKYKSDEAITEEKIFEILNICIELIELYSGEEFK